MKMIIFCHWYNNCGRMYQYLKSKLKNNWTHSVGYPNMSQFRLVDMFTATNTGKVKNAILHLFSKKETRSRVLIEYGNMAYFPNHSQIAFIFSGGFVPLFLRVMGQPSSSSSLVLSNCYCGIWYGN